ncbi:MAG: DNA polymerase III subunit gamma/tau [Bacillota bacterium]
MSYLALYREWRPRTFRDVVGQDHVVRTLVNALKKGRPSHAYLFCGPRGTGKTSIAKILSRSVNCKSPDDSNPCGQCVSCLDIEAGTSMDVTEIDAASNRGIDEVRDLREKIKFAPSVGRYRVFIVDEVHMLTNEAFNALLKTLEEPPGHAMFILATTEPHRVPLTILSRCQRFDFHRIGDGEMETRLRSVADGTGITINDEAIKLIVRAADGGLRDALGILDQAAAYSANRVGAEEIHGILGTVREDLLAAVISGLIKGNAGDILSLIGDICDQGKDLRVFLKDLNSSLRKRLLEIISSSDSGGAETDRLCRIIEKLAKTEQDMRWSTQPRILLEVALVRAARIMGTVEGISAGDGIVELAARLKEIEGLVARLGKTGKESEQAVPSGVDTGVVKKAVNSPAPLAVGADKGFMVGESRPKEVVQDRIEDPGIKYTVMEKENSPGSTGIKRQVVRPEPERDLTGPTDVIFKKIDTRWGDILEVARKVYPNIATHLTQGKGWPMEVEGKTLTIAFSKAEAYTPLAVGILQNESNMRELSDLIKSVCKEDLRVRLVESERKPPPVAGAKKKTVCPDDVDVLFGKGEDTQEEEFEGFGFED